MVWSISYGVIIKSFFFYSIIQTSVIYPCRRANEQIVTTNHAQVEDLPLKVGCCFSFFLLQLPGGFGLGKRMCASTFTMKCPKDEAPQETRDPQKYALLAPQITPCFLGIFFIWKPSRNVNLSERIAHSVHPPVISTVKVAQVCSFWYFYKNFRLHQMGSHRAVDLIEVQMKSNLPPATGRSPACFPAAAADCSRR